MGVKQGDFVRVHYTGYVDGKVFDQSEKPFAFTLGGQEVISGFQNAIIGMAPGEKKRITIPHTEAYGERDDSLFSEIPLEQLGDLPKQTALEPGIAFQLTDKFDNKCIVTVKECKPESVILDLNHPLAGKDLDFELELLEHLQSDD